jgi:hypothetical protein
MAVFTYDSSAEIIVSSEDYGLISEAQSYDEDFGLITASATIIEDNGLITLTESARPYGLFKINNKFADSRLIRTSVGGLEFLLHGKAKIFVLPKHIGSGYLKPDGYVLESRVGNNVGSGSLFGFISSTETKTNAQLGRELFRLSGFAQEVFSLGNIDGSGSLFGISGATYSRVIITKPEQSLFGFAGKSTNRRVANIVGSGSLFAISGVAERVTWDYNESSVVRPEGIDFGLVSEPTVDSSISLFANEPISNYANEIVSEFGLFPNREDYGLITSALDPGKPQNKVDYGFIIDNDTRLPFGELNLHSSTNIAFTPNFRGSASLYAFGTAKIFVLPKHKGEGEFTIAGSAGLIISLSHIGSGSLFAFTGSAESKTTAEDSKGLFEFTGSSENSRVSSNIGSGSIRKLGGSAEVVTIGEKTRERLFKLDGTAITAVQYHYTSDGGSLFTLSGSGERVTWDYNESSIVNLYSTDYGFVSESPVNYTPPQTIADYANVPISTYANEIASEFGAYPFEDDYGLIADTNLLPQQKDNYGLITDVENRFPFGKIRIGGGSPLVNIDIKYISSGQFNIEGTAPENRIFGYTGGYQENTGFRLTGTPNVIISLSHVGSGTLFSFVGGEESVTPVIPPGSGTLKVSGEAILRASLIHVGSGSLFAFTGASEAISNADSTKGLFKFFGSSSESTTPAPHIGSGSLFAFTGASESKTATLVQTGLFKFTGAAVEKNTESYVGSGTLFAFTGAAESITSSEATTGLFKFLGSAIEKNTESYVGSGSLFAFIGSSESITPGPEITSGLFKFTGAAVEKNTESYVGSGSLFSFGSSTLTFTSAEPIPGVLFKFTGSAVEKNAESYVGSGALFAFQGVAESTAVVTSASGLFRFTGAAVEKNTESYVGTGRIFSVGGHGVAYTASEKSPGVLFKFGSSSAIGFSLSEIGSGTYNLRRKVSGLDALEKQRYISAFESTTSIPPTTGALLRASGEVRLFFTYFDSGSGRFNINGSARVQTRPIHYGEGSFNIDGAANTARTRPYIGSGSLFGFISSASSTKSVPPQKTILFRFAGGAVEKNTEAFSGSAEINTSGKVFSTFSLRHIGSGTKTIFGNGIEKNTESYVGSGALFGFSGGSESVGRKLPEFKTLFRFTGAAVEKNAESHVGSGSLFAFVSKTESTSSAETKTVLFKVTGSAIEKNTESYVGSATLRFGPSKAILDENNKVIFVSATESKTSVPPIKPSTFSFHGVAKTEQNRNFNGGGTLFGFSGGAERVAFVPGISTVLFDFIGTAAERKSKSFYGSGTIFAFTGSAESTAVVSTASGLFKVTGSAKVASTPAPHIGSGSLFAFVSKTESITFSPPATTLFRFQGGAEESFTRTTIGTGRIFAFQGSTTARTVPYDTTKVLFRMFGILKESFNTGGYTGSAETYFVGTSDDRYVEYESPKPTRIYVV